MDGGGRRRLGQGESWRLLIPVSVQRRLIVGLLDVDRADALVVEGLAWRLVLARVGVEVIDDLLALGVQGGMAGGIPGAAALLLIALDLADLPLPPHHVFEVLLPGLDKATALLVVGACPEHVVSDFVSELALVHRDAAGALVSLAIRSRP